MTKDVRSRRRRMFVVAAAIVLLLFDALTARLFMLPDLAPVPPRVDAIVELGGPAVGGRDILAIQLSRANRAPDLVQSTVVEEAGTNTCLPPAPGVTVLCFHADPNTTRGEAEAIAKLARERHWRSVVLITTPDQAWRARLRTLRCFDGQVYVATSPLPPAAWLRQIPYQWAATVKALTFERSC
jgi:uncharacterized SAM-binding protein YcdF (DUF218 family)